jgi:dTDP-4-dehydrorhamnose reductase
MKILITGANGMVAKASVRVCEKRGDEVSAYDRKGLDITDRENVLDVFRSENPDAVINCAAYTDVDGAETNIGKSYAANCAGVENLALAAKESDCRFLTISTDYVFAGEKPSGFYTQKNTPDPHSVYAESKYEGERIASRTYARSIIVRTGWIFGFEGTNFLCVMDKLLAEKRKIKVIKDAFGTPTYAEDLALRLRELVELDLPLIFHVTNSGAGTSYAGFAEKVCEIGNFDHDLLEYISDEDLQRPAPRPSNSRLRCLFSDRLGLEPLPVWENALERFIRR